MSEPLKPFITGVPRETLGLNKSIGDFNTQAELNGTGPVTLLQGKAGKILVVDSISYHIESGGTGRTFEFKVRDQIIYSVWVASGDVIDGRVYLEKEFYLEDKDLLELSMKSGTGYNLSKVHYLEYSK